MKNKTQHATLQQGSAEPRSHGSVASQTEWQGNIAAMRQGNKLPSFPASESAFDAVAENRFTYGKPAAAPKGPKVNTNSYGTSCSSEKCPKDKQQDSKWVRQYVALQHEVKQERDLVTESQCSRVTWVDMLGDTCNDIAIVSYGKTVIFRKTHKMKASFQDSRYIKDDGTAKPMPLAFAKSELRRLLGVTEGDYAYTLLCRPATLRPDDPSLAPEQHGSRVADEQGIIMPVQG